MPLGRAISKGLVYTIDLSKIADRENPRTVELPHIASFTEPIVVDWGDGTPPQTISSGTGWDEHIYDTEGIYTVVVRSATGHLPKIAASTGAATADKNITLALVSIDHFCGESGNNASNRSMYGTFRNTANMSYIDPRLPGLPYWTSLSNTFSGSGIEQPLDTFNFDFSQATSFYLTFGNCAKATGSACKLPEGVTDIQNMYQGCGNLNGVIPPLPSTIQSMEFAFYNCEKLIGNFPELPVSVTGSMQYAFYGCYKLEGKLPDIPEGVTSIKDTFYQCLVATAFPDSIGSTITNTDLTFYNCQGLNQSTNAAPELWDAEQYPNITSHDRTFGALTNLSNYADIPAGWK